MDVNLDIREEDLMTYIQPGPRYTSYPTANVWSEQFTDQDLMDELRVGGGRRGLSLYVHIPFCEKLCHFCACNRVIDKSHSRENDFVNKLAQEIQLVQRQLDPYRLVEQLHWGGGTPTYLAPQQILRLADALKSSFSFSANAELSVEVNPVVTRHDHIDSLREVGFNRISMGVQDFDIEVQSAINRHQTFEQTEWLNFYARDAGFSGVNLDLIYGLPKQNLYRFEKTLKLVSQLKPDRLAVYSFANVPWKQPFHRKFSDEDLPEGLEKVKLYLLAKGYLEAEGYVPVGMDHFALPGDELAIAARERRLHRNFMGYTTRPELDLIGLGPSAISIFGLVQAQNAKHLVEYEKRIHQARCATAVGHRLTFDDEVRRDLIASIMCNFEVQVTALESKFNISFPDYFKEELENLQHFERAGMLNFGSNRIEVLGRGKILVRNIAMVFDRYLSKSREERKFSSTI